MKVVLDTNIICQDYFLEKPHFRVLFEGASAVPLTIYIPEVVLDEVVNRYREDLEEAIENFNKSGRKLFSLSKVECKTAINISDKVADYKGFLENYFRERKVEVIPYPNIPHKKIVERALVRKKPFKRDGSGYRDTLIWENVKGVMRWGDERTIFVTNNLKDFGEGPSIASELQDEIRNAHRLKVYSSLKNFNDEFIEPKLQKLEQFRIQLQNAKLELFDIRDWLQDNLLKLLRNYDLEEVLAGFPYSVGSAWVSEIVEFREIKIRGVSALEDRNKLITAFIEFEAKCSISSDWDDFINYPEVREFWGGDLQDFSTASIEIHEIVSLTVDLIVSGDNLNVDSEDIVDIYADYGYLAFGS